MTKHATFKKLVRARMAATGENYTTARAVLLASGTTFGPGSRPRPAGLPDAGPGNAADTVSGAITQPRLEQQNRPNAQPRLEQHTHDEQHERPRDELAPHPLEDPGEREYARTVRAFFTADGRLTDIPAKHHRLAMVLVELVRLFTPGTAYPEKDVNGILGAVYPDFAFLRRELVDFQLLSRENSVYRVGEGAPTFYVPEPYRAVLRRRFTTYAGLAAAEPQL